VRKRRLAKAERARTAVALCVGGKWGRVGRREGREGGRGEWKDGGYKGIGIDGVDMSKLE